MLPNGKVKGSHYLVGGLDGSSGESLQITLSGSAMGRFIDFANKDDKGASPLWLWAKTRKLSFPQAIREAKEWLGVKDDDFGIKRHKNKSFSMPEKGGLKPAEPNTKVMDYLTIERRLDPIVLANSRICETDDGNEIVFPYLESKPETNEIHCVHRKYLAVDRPNGKKMIRATKGTKRCLYGKTLISENVSEITITEGEIDALSFQSWGIPAVSIPNGVSDFEWVDIDWDWLARFEKINICMDMDEPGAQAAPDICKRLGLHRCYIVKLPKKDVNECLLAGLTREDMQKFLSSAKPIELDEIKRADDFTSEVCDYYTTDFSKQGWETPWWPQLPWRVRKAEFTILSGFSGHGKALSLDTRIPTPTGWKTMGELFPGDQVFDETGNPCNVVFATPIQLNRKCFEVEFSDGSKIVADADHLWETWTPHARNSAARMRKRASGGSNDQSHKSIQPQVVNTETISKSIYEDRWKDGAHAKHAIPVAEMLQLPDVKLPLDPYCLGAWLGDGDSSGYGITCGHGDEQILEAFYENGFAVSKHNIVDPKKCPHYGVVGLGTILGQMNLADNKHIPSEYLRAGNNQRLNLLRGLMDTDGCITDYGRCEFTSMSEVLAKSVFELVCSLGIRPTLITGKASVNGKDCGTKYRVFFTPSMHVFTLPRKAFRIKINHGNDSRRKYRYIVAAKEVPSVPVKCIQVDSERHLYLCGDAMIPTHNTLALNQLMLHLVSQGAKIMDASLEIKPGMTLYNMTRCAMAKKQSDRKEIEGCISWLNDSMFFLDCIGSVNISRLMNAMEYARKRHGVDVFVIDSLFKCGLSSEDYGGQREFTDRLTTFCNNTGAHVILVAHSRKVSSGNELNPPSKSDVSGSSDLTNGAFNVIIWWRNKLKKMKLDEAKQSVPMNMEVINEWLDQFDGAAILDKQRFGEGEEARVNMYFDPETSQFQTTRNRKFPYFSLKS